ncbi:YpjP family protein [Cytobacillus spongiae]|uniref:YpjP family protein n=1 Tax=Cytobacillus spongiae TaxID=2901381 RepID=UPI001F3B693B|nr:YpjP family protein [Cytobacillus spongiae]UII54531.1 YpjP family protein [Cytobacillus spongiae]
MPIWLRKSLVVMVTILTFGMVTPSQDFLFETSNPNKPTKRDIFESKGTEVYKESIYSTQAEIPSRQDYMSQILVEAENQSYLKFGQRIKPVIEDEFRGYILPKIEEAISNVTATYTDEEMLKLTISEVPGRGLSEKIFHIKNETTEEDIIRFHVRRDNPPQQGHWFNFHYHTYQDQFQTHHDLGSIYWNKNTPPKWMS